MGGVSRLFFADFSYVLLYLLSTILLIVVLIAIWNLRKWAVIAFVILAILGFINAAWLYPQGLTPKVIVFVIIFRGIILIPAIIYWRRMT